ncbi:MerR family transcriptional regulator [bacterium]|nr:MerR family transcriptional regulator [bacterium]
MEYKFDQVTKLTGLKQAAIRNWEKRYGFPLSRRTESGQRVFNESQLQLLLRISKALQNGEKPSTLFFELKREQETRGPIENESPIEQLGPYRVIHHIEQQDVTSHLEINRSLKALQNELLRQRNSKVAHPILKIFSRDPYFSKVSRACLSVRHGLSNEIRVLESSNSNNLFENQMPQGYRCFLSKKSTLLSLGPEDVRYCENLSDVKVQFKKEHRPTQRSLAYLVRSGFTESLALPLHGPYDSPLGFLFLNSSEKGSLEKISAEYKNELALLRQIGTLGIQDLIKHTSFAISQSSNPQRPEDYWAVRFDDVTLQRLIKLLPVRLNKIQLEPSIHYLASGKNEVALFSIGNFATAFSHAINSFKMNESENLSVTLSYENSKIHLLFKGFQQDLHPFLRQSIEPLFEAFGFAVNWGERTLEFLILTEPMSDRKELYTSVSQ